MVDLHLLRRGKLLPLTSRSLLRCLWLAGQWPLRTLAAIHIEAIKLWKKNLNFTGVPNRLQLYSQKQRNLQIGHKHESRLYIVDSQISTKILSNLHCGRLLLTLLTEVRLYFLEQV